MREPFMLYAGRIDESKGCDELFRDYAAYRASAGPSDRPLSLVLCGSSQLTIPKGDDIHYLGFVSEQDKSDAMAAARFLVLPSWFESLSIVLLEAWTAGTPVLVNGHCEVSIGQCRRSGGGLWYRNGDEFRAAADWLARDDDLRARLGQRGRDFVRRFYPWPRIVERYLEFIRFDS
jgi:glycosyltransferase involved in cell wall biosynthesis